MLFSHKKCQSALPLYLYPWMYVQQLFANKRNHVMILSLWFVIVVGRFVVVFSIIWNCTLGVLFSFSVQLFLPFSESSSMFCLRTSLSLSLIILMRIVIFFCYGHSSACRLNVLLFLGLIWGSSKITTLGMSGLIEDCAGNAGSFAGVWWSPGKKNEHVKS